MTGPVIPADQWPEWADRHCWDADGVGLFIGAVTAGYPERSKWANSHVGSGIPMPAGWDWRVPVMRPQTAPAIDLERLVSLRNRLHAMACRVGPEWEAEAGELQRDVQALIDGQPTKGEEG